MGQDQTAEKENEENEENKGIMSKEESIIKLSNFDILKRINQGPNYKTMIVRKKDNGMLMSMKIIEKKKIQKTERDHVNFERIIMEKVQHPFLIKLKYAFRTSSKLYLCTNFCGGGDLNVHLRKQGKFSEKKARFYACEILLAVDYLHKHNILYRNLQLRNCLIDEKGHIRLVDFGYGKVLSKNFRTKTFCGFPVYLSPEMLLRKGHGKAVDWWSFGIILYGMVFGSPPFYDEDIQKLYKKILNAELTFPEDHNVSNECLDLLARLLEKNPKKRLGSGMRGIAEIKYHPFFHGVVWSDVKTKKLDPPFIPTLKSPTDTSNFEDVGSHPVIGSVGSCGVKETAKKKKKDIFDGFSFAETDIVSKDKLSVSLTPAYDELNN